MKRWGIAGVALVALGLARPILCAQQAAPLIAFDGVNPLKMPKDLYLGEVTGVAVNSKGNIYAAAVQRQEILKYVK